MDFGRDKSGRREKGLESEPVYIYTTIYISVYICNYNITLSSFLDVDGFVFLFFFFLFSLVNFQFIKLFSILKLSFDYSNFRTYSLYYFDKRIGSKNN